MRKNKKNDNQLSLLKPTLVQVGRNFVDPNDVAAIVSIKKIKGLFIIRLKSNPNPEFPFWARERELSNLMKSFNVVVDDSIIHDERDAFGDE